MAQLKHVTESIIFAAAKMIDDSPARGQRQIAPADVKWRAPTHSDLTFLFERCGLARFEPAKGPGQPQGKAKRLRAVLMSALDSSEEEKGGRCVTQLIGQVRGLGGFRAGSENFVGAEAIVGMTDTLREEGFVLTPEGRLLPLSLDSLSGRELTDALRIYVRRAVRGDQDAALVAGTSKDLLEATVKHFLETRRVSFGERENVPQLLVKVCGHLEVSDPVMSSNGHYGKTLRAIIEMVYAINDLRNKEGTGHGRPWLPELTPQQARTAAQFSGVIAEFLLDLLDTNEGRGDG